jgi:hypothetical protein
LCLAVALLAGAASAQNLDSFRIIGQRNIFNLNRTPQTKTTYARPTYRSTGGESLTLVGTMAYETNQLAFFDGTSPDCRKALKLDDTIAGYKLVSISFNRVRLEANGQPVELYVGARLPRATGSAAPPSTNVEYNVSAPVATDAPAAPTASAAPAAPSGPAADPSDILKKLMQKREQEMK